MAAQGTGWDSQLGISAGDGPDKEKADGRLVLARMLKYCEAEALETGLPFVAYCLSLALGALAEQVDDLENGWSVGSRLAPRLD
ncbi:MAG: hypothetical protein ACWA6X_11310 [Bauldia sp.]